MNSTFRALEMILWSFDIKDFAITTPDPGEIIIETENPLPRDIIPWLEAQRPIGVVLTLKIAEKPIKQCYCFGPPTKDCPVHGLVI